MSDSRSVEVLTASPVRLSSSPARGYLTDVLTRIVNGYPNSDIDQLPPWAYRKQDLRAVA